MSYKAIMSDELEPIVRLIAEDRARGLSELSARAETGDKSAVVFMGLYLSEEIETTDEAVTWLLEAEKFGSPDASWNLAMIARERGDENAMRRWIDRAAELGEPDAVLVQGNGYDVASVLANLGGSDPLEIIR
jgi:TPR repeat protein